MALILADRVRETSTTTGTGTLTLDGAVTSYQSFSAVGNANTTYYTIVNQNAAEWEVGIGTYTASGTTLSRDTVLSSSNSGSLVNFSAGTKDVWGDYPAGKAVTTDTLAYPPAIGGTTAAAGTFTTLIGGADAANYGQLTGGATTKAVEFKSLGTDANIAYAIRPKGTGAIDLAAGSSGVNISNGGTVTAITRTGGGSLYTSVPSIALSAPTTAGGVQAVASITISLNSIIIASGGTGYTAGDTLTVIGGTGTAIVLTVSTVSSGVITAAAISNFGSYSVAPSNPMTVTGGTGTGATFTPNFGVQTPVTITAAGSGYVEQPAVTFSGGGGSGAAAYAVVGSITVFKSLSTSSNFQTAFGTAFQMASFGSNNTSGTNYFQTYASGSGNPCILNATGIDATVDAAISSKSTASVRFFTNSYGLGTGVEQMRVSHTASAVNYVQVTGAATGAPSQPIISALGSDANINLGLQGKGTGAVVLLDSAGGSTLRAIPRATGGDTFVDVRRDIGGVSLLASSSVTNGSVNLISKGTGAIDLAAGTSGVNISNGGTVTAITRTAAGSAYTSFPSIAISAPTTAGGVQATAAPAVMIANAATIAGGGTGYTLNDVVTLSGGTPVVAATFTVTAVSGGVVTAVTSTNFGTYSVLPSNPVSVTGGTGSGLTLTVTWAVGTTFTITAAGSGYVEQPTVTFSGGGGSGAAAYATVGSGTVIRALGTSGTQALDFHTAASATNTVPTLRLRDVSVGTSNTGFVQVQNNNGYSSIIAQGPTNAGLFIASNGTGNIQFNTNSTNETQQLRVAHTASAVNYVQVTGGATGTAPVMSAQGSDAAVGLTFNTKSTGAYTFQTNGTTRLFVNSGGTVSLGYTNGNPCLTTVAQTSQVNGLQVVGAATGSSPVLSSIGSDTNISQVFQSKGTGAIDLAAGSSGVNISNGGTVTALTRTASGSNYTTIPALAISAPTTAGGVQATASTRVQMQTDPVVVSGGTGYTLNDVLTVVGGTLLSAATFTVSAVSGGVITAATRTNAGDYTALPTNPVSVTGGTGSGATFNITLWQLQSNVATITNAGSGYVEQPTVTFSGGGGSGAAAYATVGSGTVVRSLGSTLDFITPSGFVGFRVTDVTSSGAVGYWTAYGGLSQPQLRAIGSSSGLIITQSAVPIVFQTASVEQLRVAHTASAVNYVQVTGDTTGSSGGKGPAISSQGSDADVNIRYNTKGAGAHAFATNGTQIQFRVIHVGGTVVNYTTANGSIAGSSPVFSVAGTDADIDLTLTPKGAGAIRFGTYTASVLTPTGYITIKDSGGTTRRLLVG
jgi:hypothetical protein